MSHSVNSTKNTQKKRPISPKERGHDVHERQRCDGPREHRRPRVPHGHDGRDEERLVAQLGHDDNGEGGHEGVGERVGEHPLVQVRRGRGGVVGGVQGGSVLRDGVARRRVDGDGRVVEGLQFGLLEGKRVQLLV